MWNSWSSMHFWQSGGAPGFIIPLALWSAVWTGFALWYAARRDEKWWFIIFLFVHTAGILEIIYLFFIARAFSHTSRHKKRS